MSSKQLPIIAGGLAILLALLFVACQNSPTEPTRSVEPAASFFSTTSNDRKVQTEIDPEDFVKEVDNQYLPLQPGTKFFYEGTKDGVPTTNEVFVTHQTKMILGVECTVVKDLAYEDGVLAESTFDWYAQDEEGNVWYFGEDTRELDSAGNTISTEGSWEAGVNNALPGIIMLDEPKVGERYQQEIAPGVAMDMAQVRSLDESVCVPYGCFEDVLMTKEWSLIDRGPVDHKFYAPGLGFIMETKVKGGDETSALVNITTGN